MLGVHQLIIGLTKCSICATTSSLQNSMKSKYKTKHSSYLVNLKLNIFKPTTSKSVLRSSRHGYDFEKYPHLFDDIKGKFQPLFLEHRNQMQEENWQVFVAITERDEHCHL